MMHPALSSRSESELSIRIASDGVFAPVWAREFAKACGFSPRPAWELALVVSEVASNILKFGDHGWIRLRLLSSPKAMEMEAQDCGPGIDDLAIAEQDGVSEGKRRVDTPDIRRFRGLGLGLGTIRRLTDELLVTSLSEGGTRLVARKYLR